MPETPSTDASAAAGRPQPFVPRVSAVSLGSAAFWLGSACVAIAVVVWWVYGSVRHDPLRIAINPWPGYEFASLAEELGYFDQEGVQVELVELSSLGDCRRAFERSQVDGMFVSVAEVLLTREQSSRGLSIAMVVDVSEGADVLVANPSITSLADLRGKRIAIEPGSLNAVLLARALSAAGLRPADVSIIRLPQLNMDRAYAEGQLDAVVTYPPISIALEKAGARVLYSSKDVPGTLADVLAMDASIASKRRQDLDAFVRAFFRAQEYALAHPDEALPIMASRESISPEEFREAIAGIRIVGRADQAAFIGGDGAAIDAILAGIRSDLVGLGELADATATGERVEHGD